MAADPLSVFSAPVAEWFREVFVEPTVVQREAWRAISAGQNTLVVAPTGSGKTLAAFLWSLSELSRRAPTPALPQTVAQEESIARGDGAARGTKVLYISPLKALGVDVDRNLAEPLAGIARVAERVGEPVVPIRVGVRSGDTPAAERARLLRKPPEILISTPESLYLMLTSKAAGTLTGVDTVIVDEIHAVAGTKRGAHLALSLERLDMLVGRPVQRIGLSATVNPVDTVASFLGGAQPVTVVNPRITKQWDVQVRSVVPDFQDPPAIEEAEHTAADHTALPDVSPVDAVPIDEALLGPSLISEGVGDSTGTGSGARAASGVDKESALPQQKSVWPHVQQAIYEQVMDHRSTLVFVNSRRSAERLTGALNEAYAREHDPDSLAAPTRRDPAQLMVQSGQVMGSPAMIARAHHGSVSKDERADIELALKSGELRCVVATSSLELGIDMGLVDHVIHVGAPPSVAAAVQRCGRAGHSVGAVSRATIYPLHKQDAEVAAVVVDRMLKGELEPLSVVNNALDVLAQQTVAMAVQAHIVEAGCGAESDVQELGKAGALGVVEIEQWWQIVRRAYPYAALPRDAFDGVIELISGHYPSTDFADLRPRVVYDPAEGTVSARPGAQRIAVTSGGTIPDRGMFGVFLGVGAAGAKDAETGARRVGELDEEMVYESRVGDVFTLGASSWRILEITRDQVIVAPAAGHTGRLPFWTGDAEGRPVELGRSIGQHRRAWGRQTPEDVRGAAFLCPNTVANMDSFYREQKESAGIVPDEKTLLVERFRDEIGDWRVVVHTPFGRGVNAPWAMALSARLQRDTGIDAMAVAGDDGMVLRLPYSEEPPGLEVLLGIGDSEPEGAAGTPGEQTDRLMADVMDNVGSSALFAGRFRECAARSLLLPRRHPGKRQPLWQQRQRAAQLLDVARNHPEFPVMVETMRECLHDVYALDELGAIVRGVHLRGGDEAIRVAEVTTEAPSAFAESLLFTYTSAFMYEGDSAERAASLAVDPTLLSKVLGKTGEGLLLDPAVIAQVVDVAQWLADGRRAVTAEQVVDMLRMLGPLSAEQILERCDLQQGQDLLAEVQSLIPQRVVEVNFGGAVKFAVVEDMPVLRDGLGVPVPPGVVANPTRIPDALDQLLLRWMRHRGPTLAAEAAAEFGLGVAAADALLRRWVEQRRLAAGIFWEESALVGSTGKEKQYIDIAILRRLRSATLAAARGAVEPVSHVTYARFLLSWHGLGESEREDLLGVIEQLSGVPLPASAWETLVLPARIPGYQPVDLDDLLSSGEVIAVGAGAVGSNDSLVMLLRSDLAPMLLDQDSAPAAISGVAEQIREHLSHGGAFLATELAQFTGADPRAVDQAIWELFDAGVIAPDSFAAVRRRLAESGNSGKQAHRAPRRDRGRGSMRRLRMGRSSFAQAARSEEAQARRAAINAHASVPGRWAAVPKASTDAANRAVARSEAWLDRYGVVTRGSIIAEKSSGGFAETYRTLSAWEDSGVLLRGYVVDGLGGAQFAPRDIINQLRRMEEGMEEGKGSDAPPLLLAAADPANPYGSALPWPAHPEGTASPHRGSGALVVLHRGQVLAYLTRGARTMTLFADGEVKENRQPEVAANPAAVASTQIGAVVEALAAAVRAGHLAPVVLEKINGVAVMERTTASWIAAGARLTPKGLRINA